MTGRDTPATETTGPTPWDSYEGAQEIAQEAVACFSKKHPQITMNYDQWLDLVEMIRREILGRADTPSIGAKDLLS